MDHIGSIHIAFTVVPDVVLHAECFGIQLNLRIKLDMEPLSR